MRRSTLILAAHGSRLQPAANEFARSCAARLSRLGLFDEVAVAFQHGTPAFARVLDEIHGDDVTVVPFMTSTGYYSEVVLPRELSRSRRFRSIRVRRTLPVGCHPGIIPLVARRVANRLAEYRLDPGATTLVLVGHGTQRDPRSRAATVELAGALARFNLCAEVLPAFLEEAPRLATIGDPAACASLVVEPFFIGGGPHTTRDIPAGLGLGACEAGSFPFSGHRGRQFVVCDAPVGTDPSIIEIILDLARSPGHGARDAQAEAS